MYVALTCMYVRTYTCYIGHTHTLFILYPWQPDVFTSLAVQLCSVQGSGLFVVIVVISTSMTMIDLPDRHCINAFCDSCKLSHRVTFVIHNVTFVTVCHLLME